MLLAINALIFSCSLNYEQAASTEDSVPELIFNNASLSVYKDAKLQTKLEATALEQYKTTGAFYGKDIKFFQWDEDGEVSANGACDLFYANIDSKNYSLFGNISLSDIKHDMTFHAAKLKWNGDTEQLTSGLHDKVSIIRSNMQLEGVGFSASGPSRKFSFLQDVSGVINTKDESEETKENAQ